MQTALYNIKRDSAGNPYLSTAFPRLFLDTSPSQTYSTLHPASSHLSTSYKAALKLAGHAAEEGVMDVCRMGADAEQTMWLDV